MTKKQKAFFDYLQKLKTKDIKFVQVALLEFFKYWENYDRQGVKDSMNIAMEATEAFVGLPVKVHLN